MTILQLREYHESEPVELSVADRDALQQLIKRATISPVVGRSDHYTINPRNTVGVVRTDDLVVEIQPKLPIERVLFLVAYALDPAYWRQHLVELKSAETLHEAIARPFADFAEFATRRGVLNGYQQIDESIAGVKGRIRVSDQMSKRGRLSTPVEVSYDEFTPDIEENRLLLAASQRLLKLQRLDPETHRSLRRVVKRLNDVTLARYRKNQVPHLRITRLNRRYERSLALAELILNDETIELSAGSTTTSGLLFDMANVFETFVHVALREALNLSDREFPRNAGNKLFLDSGQNIKLEPDLSWWQGPQCVFVGDVKYKKNDDGSGKNPDLYQLLAYATATQLNEGFLIYAATETDPVRHLIPFAEKQLHVRTLHLDADPSNIFAEIDELAGIISSSRPNSQLLSVVS